MSIVGSGFTGATAVDFGAFVVGSFTVVDDSHITAGLPVGSSGAVDVVVTTPGGSSAVTSADVFEDLPCITGVSPSSGAVGGGTSVTITGHGFYGVTAVSFGATAATSFTTVSDTEMFATSPAGSGTVDVTASFRGQASATSSADQFTYGTPSPSPPTLSSSFTPTSITAGGTSALAFTVTNPNASTALSGVGFTDTLPAGLVIATPNGLTGSCGGGTITATASAGSISLSGTALAASASCTFSLTTTPASSGSYTNTTSAPTSTEAGNGSPATATLTVTAASPSPTPPHPSGPPKVVIVPQPPSLSASFAPTSVAAGSSATLAFTVNNPNPTIELTGLGFTDTLPAGLIVAAPNGLAGNCGGGTITAAAGGTSITLAGATLPTDASCTFTLVVTGANAGTYTDTTSPISSSQAGSGDPASATLTVTGPDLALQKHHLGVFVTGQPGSYELITTNVGDGPTTGTITLTDTLPVGETLSRIAPASTFWSCSHKNATITCISREPLSPGERAPLITLHVALAANLAGHHLTNTAHITTPSDGNPSNDTASDTVVVLKQPPARIDITEPIAVTDTPQELPPVSIPVSETITVSDSPQLLPPSPVSDSETITSNDSPQAVAPFPGPFE